MTCWPESAARLVGRMASPGRSVLAIWAIALLTCLFSTDRPLLANEETEAFFESRIRPLLVGRCQKCHSGATPKGGLRVDSREALVQGGKHGSAIVAGDAAHSLLIDAVLYAGRKMPPDAPLPSDAIADLKRWIDGGAPWPESTTAAAVSAEGGAANPPPADAHWAFQPVREVPVPGAADLAEVSAAGNAIDQFILARLRREGLEQVGQADRGVLARRLYFDLIGLPPTPEEIDDFVSDPRPDALARVVERLLASPHYGERWGRHWMDVVRYADTAGDNADYPVPEARLYRDHIIDAFNRDKPYDEFVREQLAGDILLADVAASGDEPDARRREELVAATGFLALSRRYGTAPYELWHLTLEDTIDTTGRALMGLTLRCARCHDHKFDPVTNEDYYALYGIFASSRFAWTGGEELHSKGFDRQNFVPLASAGEAAARLATYREAIDAEQREIARLAEEDPAAVQVKELDAKIKAQREALAAQAAGGETAGSQTTGGQATGEELAELEKARAQADGQLRSRLDERRKKLRLLRRPGLPADLPAAYAVAEGTAADARLQYAGEPDDLGDVVPRGAPAFLSADAPLAVPAGASGRWQLAQWLTRPDHPLTARVLVNRVWQYHFGKGLVATPSNFGLRGEPPTHPELLDWLTLRFIESGWSIKSLHRTIVLSRTYALASGADAAPQADVDQANRWYWRRDRRRLDAEALRDAMLAVAGNLDCARPGAHPFPPIETWTWTQHNPFKAVYPSNHRSVYLMTQRIQRHPYLALFDGPDPNVSTDARTSATVPLQALYLMNHPFVAEQAAGLVRRALAAEPSQRIERAYRLAYGRTCHADEAERANEFLAHFAAEAARLGGGVEQAEREAWSSLARVLLTSNEFLYVD
jgi:hypothetical protein